MVWVVAGCVEEGARTSRRGGSVASRVGVGQVAGTGTPLSIGRDEARSVESNDLREGGIERRGVACEDARRCVHRAGGGKPGHKRQSVAIGICHRDPALPEEDRVIG